MKCPNCAYVRSQRDQHIHEGICPNCGIAYGKWRSANQDDTPFASDPRPKHLNPSSIWSRLGEHFGYVPEEVKASEFWGRVLIAGAALLWGGYFIVNGISWEVLGGSFLHNVNLPFHEFGHVLFAPFGRFMGILGGSLFQIMMPLIALIGFSFWMHDNFAAAIMLWWCGQSFMDVAPYILDAPTRSLPLILGLGDQYHDWGNLLTMTNSLHLADDLAYLSFSVGIALMLVSFGWTFVILRRQKQRLNDSIQSL